MPGLLRRLARVAAGAAYSSGVVARARELHRDRLLVVSYHSVVDLPEPPPERFRFLYRNSTPATQFEAHMRYLKKHYALLGPGDLEGLLEGEFPPRPAMVTFDDGLACTYTVAAPILRKLGLPAFFFVPTAFVDAASEGELQIPWTEEVPLRVLEVGPSPETSLDALRELLPTGARSSARSPDRLLRELLDRLKRMRPPTRQRALAGLRAAYPDLPDPRRLLADRSGTPLLATMRWSELRELAGAGMGIGSHTEHHSILGRLGPREAEREIRESMRRIEEEVCPPYRVFAYPNGQRGDFRARDVEVLRHEGYQAAFTQMRGLNAPGQEPLALRRFNIGACPLPRFACLVSGLGAGVRDDPAGREWSDGR